MNDEEILQRVIDVARAEGLPVPATEAVVNETEQRIGLKLPTLLRRLYVEAANGGFGPEDGVLGVPGGDWNGEWSDILHLYSAIRDDPEDETPPYFVWLYEWGCGIWSLIDCRDPSGPMWGWDPNDGIQDALFPTEIKFAEWMTQALNDDLEMPEKQ